VLYATIESFKCPKYVACYRDYINSFYITYVHLNLFYIITLYIFVIFLHVLIGLTLMDSISFFF